MISFFLHKCYFQNMKKKLTFPEYPNHNYFLQYMYLTRIIHVLIKHVLNYLRLADTSVVDNVRDNILKGILNWCDFTYLARFFLD